MAEVVLYVVCFCKELHYVILISGDLLVNTLSQTFRFYPHDLSLRVCSQMGSTNPASPLQFHTFVSSKLEISAPPGLQGAQVWDSPKCLSLFSAGDLMWLNMNTLTQTSLRARSLSLKICAKCDGLSFKISIEILILGLDFFTFSFLSVHPHWVSDKTLLSDITLKGNICWEGLGTIFTALILRAPFVPNTSNGIF